MQCNAMQCNAMQCNAMQCNAMQCNAMQRNAMQCNAMQCNAMQCYAMLCYAMLCYAMLCYAMLCYAMLCYALHCKDTIPCHFQYIGYSRINHNVLLFKQRTIAFCLHGVCRFSFTSLVGGPDQSSRVCHLSPGTGTQYLILLV